MVKSTATQGRTPAPDHHGWLGTETVKTRFGNFEFRNGYPTQAAAEALHDQLRFNRAIEVYMTQIPAVAMLETRRGLRDFGARRYNQVVIWENLMDAKTLLLTANTETVYGIGILDLRADGPTVVEVPPKMLGAAQDLLQRWLTDFGPLAPDKGQGGKYLFLPPDHKGAVPDGYFVVRSSTYPVIYFMRGFKVEGKTEPAVALMKQLKVYPLARGDHPPAMEFLNGSGEAIDTVHSDNFTFFEALAQIVEEEPADVFTPLERFYMQAIGIEKGKKFAPDAKRKTLLSDAARAAAAFARANSFASDDPSTYFYKDRQWQALTGVPCTFLKNDVLEVDLRAFVYYMAAGNSPGMTEKHVGQGSQYLWTYRDADEEFLDGAKSYRLRVPAKVPINNFWSVLVYDALSRSQLQNSQKFPSVSMYGDPKKNDDGSVDVYFGPKMPKGQEKNWIETVPGKGWFPIFRFYGPLDPYFDQTWKLNDIEKVK